MSLLRPTLVLACAAGLAFAQTVSTCAAGLHMIVARASTEPPGEGIIGAVVDTVHSKIPGSDSVAVKYTATLGDYFNSEALGTKAMTDLLEEYVVSCPNAKIALFGYSQGAQVVGDTVCGTSEIDFTKTAPLSPQYNKNIVAVIQMGDPSFVPGLPYDVGTSKAPGVLPRQNTSACLPYASRIQSYCDANDEYCASGDSLVVHIGYVQEYGTRAASFVVQQYNNGAPASSGTSSTATMSPATSALAGTSTMSPATSTLAGTSTMMQSTTPAGMASASSSSPGAGAGPVWRQAGLKSWAAALLLVLNLA